MLKNKEKISSENDYFPSKLALGDQFCNRIKEKTQLYHNIEQCRHTVLIAPRRYGKSSLVFKVSSESSYPLSAVDLFLAHDDLSVTKRILTGVSQAISQIMPFEQKVLGKLQVIFNHFRVSMTAFGFGIEATIETSGFDPVDQVLYALKGLSTLATQQKKKVIFFIDEFQDIRESNSSKSIQGAIRHVAQETAHIEFIFSGSNRRLLLELFDDKTKPLYMLCDMMALERMTSHDYRDHLQKQAMTRFKKPLPDFVFEKIIAFTELHPYYVNLLCHELWKSEHIPDMDAVFTAWQYCYESHEDRLISDLEKLTAKQQNILKSIAVNPVTEPTGQQFTTLTKSSSSTINQTIKSLLNKDMIYKVKKTDELLPQVKKNQLRILDPLLSFALKKYAS